MKHAGWILLALAAAPSAAQAAPSDVNAQTFYTHAQALEKKGMGAMFDSRLRPVIAQLKDAGTRARAANASATSAGSPLYCVPEGARKKGMNPKQILAILGRVPEADRRTSSLFEVWQRALASEYPCR